MFSCIFSDDSLGYEYPFTLKVVQKDGLTCAWCPWHRWAYIKKNTFVYIYPPGGRNYYRNRIFWYISFNEINIEFGYFFFIKVLMLA